MSQPLSQCIIFKAALGDEQAYKFVLDAMKYNKKCGHYSIFPCTCNPPCKQPSKEQGEELNRKITEATIARFNKKYDENKQYIDNILNSRQYK